MTINEFDLYRFLGAGGFGMVLLAKKKDSGKFYAIKVIDKRILISQNQVRSTYAFVTIRNSLQYLWTPRLTQNVSTLRCLPQTHSIFREKEVLACVEHPFIVALRYAFQVCSLALGLFCFEA